MVLVTSEVSVKALRQEVRVVFLSSCLDKVAKQSKCKRSMMEDGWVLSRVGVIESMYLRGGVEVGALNGGGDDIDGGEN